MREMHILAILDPREIQPRMVIVAGQSEAFPTAVRIHQTYYGFPIRMRIDVASKPGRGLVRHRLGARHEEHLEWPGG